MSSNIFISIITIIILIIIIIIVIIYPIKKYEQFDVSASTTVSTDDLLKRIEVLEHPKQLCIDTVCINKEQWEFLGKNSLIAITAIAKKK